jgi:hypothetical protein
MRGNAHVRFGGRGGETGWSKGQYRASPRPLLHRLSAQQSSDLYELIIERYRQSSFVFTSNRAVDEWLGLFDDPILGNSALDRLAHGAYQLIIEGTSYRANKAPRITDQD